MSRNRFGLAGPSVDLDPRTHAIRGDLADVALAGRLFAPHYAEPIPMSCACGFAAMHDTAGGQQNSELLGGEHYMALDIAGGWAWGWSAHDHYVGYVDLSALERTEDVAPDIKPGHPVEIAQGFLGMAYLWGGRGGAGIDCSGLVQRALAGVGIAAPRDSDMQQAELGHEIGNGPSRSGDLIFFPGHVGMMVDEGTLIHATRHHGKVVEEPLDAVVARILAKKGTAIVARKRLTS